MNRRHRAALRLSLLAAIFLAPAVARAQAVTPDPVAVQLFDDGRKLAAEGRLQEAIAKFDASVHLQRSVGALLNLAECHDKLGHTASAWAAFRGAAAAAKDTHDAEREAIATARAAALEPQLLHFTIDVPPASNVAGLRIERDDEPVPTGEWGTAVPTDPGTHRIVVSAPGRKSWTTTIEVTSDGEHESIPLLALSAPATAPAPREDRARWTRQKTLAVVAGGIGVAGVGVGSYFGLTAIAKNDSANSFCDPVRPSQCNQAGVNEGRDASQAATISTIAFAAGGAFILGAVILFVTSPKGEASAGRVQVGAIPGTGALPSMMTVRASF